MVSGGTEGERARGRAPYLAKLLPGLFVSLLALACGPGPEELRARDPRPNVVIISMDTTRADHLSAYGYERDTSASLRALAGEGMRFEVAYSPSATTAPSHASLFTGLAPIAHGVVKNGRPLEGDFETLAETLGDEGYETAAVVSSYVLSGRFGFDQGFDHFDADFSQADVVAGDRLWEGELLSGKFHGRADDTTRRGLQWLDARRHPERPFFLFVHYFDPHTPYLPPEGYEPPFRPGAREALKLNRTIFLYDTLIAFTDQEIGRLLQGLEARGLEGDTLVIVVGDHGEGLMSHGHMFHGVHIYEEGVRVPLIVRWPGQVPAGVVAPGPVDLADLAPSVLELAGVSSTTPVQGQSIASFLLGGDDLEAERPVHLYRRHYEGGDVVDGLYAEGEKFGLRRGRWKLIEGPEEGTLELFDLETDPGEKDNLVEGQPERVQAMREEIAAWRRAHTQDAKDGRLPSAEEREGLEALGYTE
ncbi:MAG: sulfatase [Myxococcota bacterium]|jgi:arylsulfatase A-like enzyme|nr:sulfatase [Myxococcota bacterium]